MSLKVEDYALSRTAASITNSDLFDITSTNDGGVTYASAKMTFAELMIKVNEDINNIYQADGTLTAARTITSAGHMTTFDSGDVAVQASADPTTFGYKVLNNAGATKAFMVLDHSTNSGSISLENANGVFFSANNELVDAKMQYAIDGTPFLVKKSGTSGNDFILIGGGASYTSGSTDRGIAIGEEANVYGNSIAIGDYAANSDLRSIAIGSNAASGLNSIAIGINTNAADNSIAIGYSTETKANQFVAGSAALDCKEVIFGSGEFNEAASIDELKFRMTSVIVSEADTGTDSPMIFEAARGRGTGSGGSIVFRTSVGGGSGTDLNDPLDTLVIKNSGVINMSRLPTSAAGLSTGDLWNDGGIISIA